MFFLGRDDTLIREEAGQGERRGESMCPGRRERGMGVRSSRHLGSDGWRISGFQVTKWVSKHWIFFFLCEKGVIPIWLFCPSAWLSLWARAKLTRSDIRQRIWTAITPLRIKTAENKKRIKRRFTVLRFEDQYTNICPQTSQKRRKRSSSRPLTLGILSQRPKSPLISADEPRAVRSNKLQWT